ncbi:(2Fe-2S)-binding protein [Streptomyces sp. NPDC047928]|uniref:(2Fe-2S)-binding protein n=1 Tax=unclassified Streptomyces TaxID=2593676 RepID=UPI003715FE0E
MDLDEAASIGGFFALRAAAPADTSADTSASASATHRPLAEVYAGDHAPLADRVARVGARLRTDEFRVAASIAHLGLAARLWSVALGPAALYGEFPDVTPGTLRWDGARTSPDDLWWTGARTRPGTADAIRETVQYGHLVPLAEALRAAGPVSPRLLWGNAGSALAGALRELTRWARREGRPQVAERAAELTTALFAHPDLAGTVHGRALRRRTCCLYYRCPGGGLCGDCVFDRPPSPPGGRSGLAAEYSAP